MTQYLLTEEQVSAIAEFAAKKLNFGLGDALEKELIAGAIAKINVVISGYLPSSLISSISEAGTGLSSDRVKVLYNNVLDKVNAAIDIPFLDEQEEKDLLRWVIDVVTLGLTKEFNLDKAIAEKS